MYKALDLSNYDIDVANNAKCLVDNGWTKFIQGAQRIPEAKVITNAMLYEGAELLAVYCFLYFGYNVEIEVAKAIDVAKEFNCKWIVMDVESTAQFENGVQTPSSRVAYLKQAIKYAEDRGYKVIIYTAGWYWIPYMGNNQEFSKYPLWHAEYGVNDGTKPPVYQVSYGGWTDVSIHQYCSGVSICGRNRDQNYVINEDLFSEETMDKEFMEAVAKRFAIISMASKTDDDGYFKMLQAYDLLKANGLL